MFLRSVKIRFQMFVLQREKVCPKDKDLLLTQPVAGVIGASFR